MSVYDIYGDTDYKLAMLVESTLRSIRPGPGLPYATNIGDRVYYGKCVFDENDDEFPTVSYTLLASSVEENDTPHIWDEIFDLVVEVHLKTSDQGLLLATHQTRRDVVNALLSIAPMKGIRDISYTGFDVTTRNFGSKISSQALNFVVTAIRCEKW